MSTTYYEEIDLNNLYAGSNIVTALVVIGNGPNPNPGEPTVFIITYTNNGVIPTGNNIRVYRVGVAPMELPILSTYLNTTVRMLYVTVPPGYVLLDPAAQYIVQFEVIAP